MFEIPWHEFDFGTKPSIEVIGRASIVAVDDDGNISGDIEVPGRTVYQLVRFEYLILGDILRFGILFDGNRYASLINAIRMYDSWAIRDEYNWSITTTKRSLTTGDRDLIRQTL